jgi:hypothetical protein
MVMAAGLYHWVFLKGAREGWPVIGSLVRLMVRDEFEQRDRFMRENLDAMARKLGEMQAKLCSWKPWASASRAWRASTLPTSARNPGAAAHWCRATPHDGRTAGHLGRSGQA